MSKIEEVRSAMVAAMKAKDKDTKETLSALLASLKNKAIDKRADLTEEEEVQVIMKEIKQTKETLEMTPADREDIIEECKKRLAVLEPVSYTHLHNALRRFYPQSPAYIPRHSPPEMCAESPATVHIALQPFHVYPQLKYRFEILSKAFPIFPLPNPESFHLRQLYRYNPIKVYP